MQRNAGHQAEGYHTIQSNETNLYHHGHSAVWLLCAFLLGLPAGQMGRGYQKVRLGCGLYIYSGGLSMGKLFSAHLVAMETQKRSSKMKCLVCATSILHCK